MGEWIDTAWVKAPVDAVIEGLIAVIATTGRALVPTPAPRTREPMDPMQYDADADRWAVAVRAGARGWSIIKTAPMDLLALPEVGAPRLAWLCAHLKAPGLHHSVMDGSADRLVECDPAGQVSRWGMWGMSASGSPAGWTEDHADARLERIDLALEAAAVRGLHPVRGVVVGGAMLKEAPAFVVAAGERLERRLTALGADFGPPVPGLGMRMWSADAAAIVEALTDPEPMGIGSVALAGALDAVLSGDAFEATGNELSVVNLVEARPIPGWAMHIFERSSVQTVQKNESVESDF